MQRSDREKTRAGSRRVPLLLLVLATWGSLAPYVATALGLIVVVRPIVEVVDHVIPGVILLAIAAAALATRRFPLVAALAAALASLWMTATHVPLVVQGARGGVSMAAALFHSIPGMAALVVSVVAVVLAWDADERGADVSPPAP
ncbi:MAG: hypothetical protein ACRDJ4_07775 [Actinomycetota bacterium]